MFYDTVHLTPFGNEVLARTVADMLEPYLEQTHLLGKANPSSPETDCRH